MIREYAQADLIKIHLDCSMRLGDDPGDVLALVISAQRTAQLIKVAESSISEYNPLPRYVIGTEGPVPGGNPKQKEVMSVTKVEDARQTIEVTRAAFYREGLQSAWERVRALIVQPGVEFGDDFVQPYKGGETRALSRFIER